jgi:hypothetical protein
VDVCGRFRKADLPGAIIGADGNREQATSKKEIMAAKGFWTGWSPSPASSGHHRHARLQGLTALIKDEYYVLAPNRILLFDVTTWGWIMLV